MAIKPFRHLGLKALSLGLAIVLWLIVAGEEAVERGLRVPLELQQVPAGLELQGNSPAFVDVRVRGGSTTLTRMSAEDIVAVLDLRSTTPGERLFQMTPEQVRVPFGVEVIQIIPSSLTLTLERTRTRVVPVKALWEGDPAPGYEVGEVTTTPSTVEVAGPESVVNRVTEAVTDPVSVAGKRQTVTGTVSVGFVDQQLRVQNPHPATVNVQVEITRAKD